MENKVSELLARQTQLSVRHGRLGAALDRAASELPETAPRPADKPAAGKRFNEVKNELEAALATAQARLAEQPQSASVQPFDPTVPGARPVLGHLHPITQTIEELKDIMGRLGFSVADGPEIEDEWHNFEALNIPLAHPARDPLENFYLATAERTNSGPLLLRSQTSTVQIRVMESQPPPVRVIAIGRVYRPDTVDATHSFMFHQVEGLMVDEGVTMADLKTVLGQALDSGAQAILTLPSALMVRNAPSLAAACIERRMPLISGWASIARSGALMTYGPNLEKGLDRVAYLVRIES